MASLTSLVICVGVYLQRRSPEDAKVRELAPEFRPPEWLTDVVARTTPYFPQMGDEVIYFVQGHQQYVEAVRTNGVYRIDVDRNQPWHKMPHIRVRPPPHLNLYIIIIIIMSANHSDCRYAIRGYQVPVIGT